MKPWMPFQIQSVRSWEDLRRFTSQGFQNLYQMMNGNVGFQDNVNCQIKEVTLTTASTPINHTLNKVAIGYLVIYQDANSTIYVSNSSWDNNTIWLAASATVTAKIAILGG